MSAPRRSLRLAYLTSEYPKVSHTFIRREIQEIERLGHHVLRLAIRRAGAALVDAADFAEAERTHYCLDQPWPRLAAATLRVATRRPLAFLSALALASAMSRASERGWLRHLAYLVEAAHLLEVLERANVQHVHVHFGTNPAAVARLIRCLGGPGYSFTAHGPDEFDAPIGLSLGAKIAEARFVVAISRYGSAQLRRWVGAEHWPRLHIVHCSAGPRFFAEAAPIRADSNLLVCVGRLSAQKGQLVLLEAFARLLKQGWDARLVLAGDGELRAPIEQRIRSLGIGDRVEITGWVDEAEVCAWLRAARGLVLASFAEGLPVVIMEALALGRPVVTTDVAGIPELVRDGQTGWLVPPADPEALATAMAELLASPLERLEEMARFGASQARLHHSAASEARKLETLFRRYAPAADAGEG